MNRTRSILATLVAAVLAVAVVACNSSAPPTLKDPKDIANRAITATRSAKAIHGRMAASGSVRYSGSALGAGLGGGGPLGGGAGPGSSTAGGTGTGGMTFNVNGTTGEFWYDTGTKNARLTVDAPSVANTTAEAIRIGSDAYVRLSGMFAPLLGLPAGKYVKVPLSEAEGSFPAATSVPDAVESVLNSPDAPLVLIGVEKQNGRESYHLRTTVPKDRLADASSLGISVSAVTVNVWVAADNQQVSHLEVTSAGDGGTVTLAVDFDYPNGVNIKAPAPADIATPALP